MVQGKTQLSRFLGNSPAERDRSALLIVGGALGIVAAAVLAYSYMCETSKAGGGSSGGGNRGEGTGVAAKGGEKSSATTDKDRKAGGGGKDKAAAGAESADGNGKDREEDKAEKARVDKEVSQRDHWAHRRRAIDSLLTHEGHV